MTLDQLAELGFNLEQLPSGRYNLNNTVPFRINGMTTIVANRGRWSKTLEQKSIPALLAYIETLELINR